MEISKLKSGLLHVIEGNNGKRVGVGELRVNLMARDCFNAIQELETENAQLHAVITESDPDFFKRKCRVCGCDWNHPCNDHDYWVKDDLCSACAKKIAERRHKLMPNEKLLVSQEAVSYLKKEAREWSVNAPGEHGQGMGAGMAFALAKLGLDEEAKS